MEVHFCHPEAKLPCRMTDGAAGYDISTVEEVFLQPHARACVRTGLQIKIPPGYYGRIAPRSSYARDKGLDILAGVIDRDYMGEVFVVLVNTDKDTPIRFQCGDRIAQLVVEKIATPTVVRVHLQQWGEAGWFGSTSEDSERIRQLYFRNGVEGEVEEEEE